jgi:DNA-binding SARP family transcriptional activator
MQLATGRKVGSGRNVWRPNVMHLIGRMRRRESGVSVADRDHESQAPGSGRHRFTPQAVARSLDLIETRAAQASDETLMSAVKVGRQALADWQEQADRLRDLEEEYQGRACVESKARMRLLDVLDLLGKLVNQPESSSLPAQSGELTPGGLALPPRVGPVRETPGGLAVRMLGSFDLTIDGRPVTHWHGQRTRSLMQFLAAHRLRGVSRDELIAAVWPDVDEESGRHRLHQGIYELRSTLRAADPGRSPIVCVDGGYGFDRSVPVWVDVEVFDGLVSAAMRTIREQRVDEAIQVSRAALELYRGDFLRQATDADWATSERNRLAARFVLLSILLGELLTRRGDCRAALAVIDPVLSVEPWNEDATVLKMRCHATTGARSMAATAYRACAEALASEFGIKPAAHTVRVYEQIRSGAPAQLRGRVTQARDRTAPRPPSLPGSGTTRPAP